MPAGDSPLPPLRTFGRTLMTRRADRKTLREHESVIKTVHYSTVTSRPLNHKSNTFIFGNDYNKNIKQINLVYGFISYLFL